MSYGFLFVVLGSCDAWVGRAGREIDGRARAGGRKERGLARTFDSESDGRVGFFLCFWRPLRLQWEVPLRARPALLSAAVRSFLTGLCGRTVYPSFLSLSSSPPAVLADPRRPVLECEFDLLRPDVGSAHNFFLVADVRRYFSVFFIHSLIYYRFVSVSLAIH